MSDDINALGNNKLNSEKLFELTTKVDLLLQQHEATQKAICHLRRDIPSIIREVICSILKKRTRR
jgi:hypothetical protein